MVTSADAVAVTAPRVNDKRTDPDSGQRMRFSSAILAPWARKTPQISEVLPLQYLHGLSSGDFVPALAQFVGACTGLSAPVITKLTQTWQAEASAFMTRDLFGVHYVYLWVDGIHLGIRLGEGKLWLLVMIGVRADGCVELIGLADGCRESAESWADLLRDCARRGMRAPVLAVGALKAKRKGGQAPAHSSTSAISGLPRSPVLATPPGPDGSIVVSAPARGQCSTPRGATKSSRVPSATSRSRIWMVACPPTTAKNSPVIEVAGAS